MVLQERKNKMLIIRFLIAFVLAIGLGKLVSKLKLPAILGWLLAGMILGPHALGVVNQPLLNSVVYERIGHVLECAVGLMIGTELVWKKIKSAGKQIMVTTLTQSLGTFAFVSLVFAVTFYFMDIPLYLAFLFGGIALATAPAPALSIVREFKTDGPVTKTLIPMAALDDMVGVIVFFTTMAIVSGHVSSQDMPIYMSFLVVLLPLVIGIVVGVPCGWVMNKVKTSDQRFLVLLVSIVISSLIGMVVNYHVLPSPLLNFMLIGMAFSAAFSNIISNEDQYDLMTRFNPILSFSMVVVILNLGAPLDYHLIFGAGLFTAIYIIARALGKYFGAYFGASITHCPETVKKYLGLTLLPHSGVSLVFTGIAVSSLSGPAPESAQIIQGTIAAAAVINELIAVVIAKKGFEWANEMPDSQKDDELKEEKQE